MMVFNVYLLHNKSWGQFQFNEKEEIPVIAPWWYWNYISILSFACPILKYHYSKTWSFGSCLIAFQLSLMTYCKIKYQVAEHNSHTNYFSTLLLFYCANLYGKIERWLTQTRNIHDHFRNVDTTDPTCYIKIPTLEVGNVLFLEQWGRAQSKFFSEQSREVWGVGKACTIGNFCDVIFLL